LAARMLNERRIKPIGSPDFNRPCPRFTPREHSLSCDLDR
jgi:hypothetical protein